MRRRQLLAVSAAGVAGLAGCGGSSGEETTESGGGNTPAGGGETTTTDGMDGGTTTEQSGDGMTTAETVDLDTPGDAVGTFYTTLFSDADVEGANALYHPESQAPAIEAEDFAPFGGVEAMQAEVESVETFGNTGSRVQVHADIAYTTPAGNSNPTDLFYLRKDGEQWNVSIWLPSSARQRLAKSKVEEFYATLYDEADVEAANAMYHSDSDAPPIEAADFEPFGGLSSMQAEITGSEIVEENVTTAEIHADVEYTTPAGNSTATDYVFLRLERGVWKVDRWLPEAARESAGTTTASGQ